MTKKIGYEILTTRGVTSRVDSEIIDDSTNEIIGKHAQNIGLFDFDVGISKTRVLNEVMDLDGINLIWRSSQTGFHVWNLSIRTIDEIAMMGLKMGADCKHVQSGVSRGHWVLRISPKWYNEEIYKPEPKFLHTLCNPSARPQSLPHMRLFNALTGKTICEKGNYTWTGESADIEAYRTYTDEIKMELEKGAMQKI